ncbi:hypothetical protein GOP47_0022853 [Adiantum capillus-veneris]|uniref:Protein kinase domain-containing protein n=1 Tax=Adiantum capillus-veneris TaxID=13818 RepID=A0A9D4U666_ADICA|nr:hypothetical protein GOP47_0022853 [Adiantum capillus-veneris]
MGFSCFALGAFFNQLLLRNSWRHPSSSLHRLWNRFSPCKRLLKLLKKRLNCHGKVHEMCSIQEEQGQQIKKQQKGKLLSRHRPTNAAEKSFSVRKSFGRVPSWSRFVEESVGRWSFVEESSSQEIGEIVLSASAVETDWAVDLSQLFLGHKFASGAHSRLYHGIYQNRTVAVKLIMPPCEDLQLSSQLSRQFFLEVTLLSRLQHSNIIKFVGACKRPPIYCVITEYLPGGSLKAFLHKIEPNSISISLIVRMALDVATDFGVSCLESQRNTMKGFMGTYRWMAPEMLKEELCSKKVDVYSFGIVLWELCTGLIPFGDMTPVQAAFAICQEKARPTIPDHCPKELAELMHQCWCNKPTKRPEFVEIVNTLNIFALKVVRS